MTTLLKTTALLISAVLLISACGEEPSSNQPAVSDHNDAHNHDQDHADQNGMNQTVSDAQALIEAATKHINENKLDLAEKALKQLDKLRADLPDSLNQKIDAAKAALTAAKAAAGKMELPKLN